MLFVVLIVLMVLSLIVIKSKIVSTPAGVLVIFMTLLIALPLVFFSDMLDIKYVGLFFITGCLALFVCGHIIAIKIGQKVFVKSKLFCNRQLSVRVLAILILLGFINPICNIYSHGFSLLDLVNLDRLTEMTKQFSWERYSDETTYSKLIQFTLLFSYSASIIGGFCFLFLKNVIHKLFCVASVAPCFFITVSQSTKMQMIVAVIFWISGLLIFVYTYNIKIRLSLRIIVGTLLAVVIFAVSIFLLSITRWNNKIDNLSIEKSKTSFIVNSIGSFFCFDHWFYNQIHGIDYSTELLHNSTLYQLGTLHNIENGVKVVFDEAIPAPSMEIFGRRLDECKYYAGKKYTIQFDVTSDEKPDSVRISLVSYSSLPYGHFLLMMDSCSHIGLHTWHYSRTFCLDSNRICVQTPDIILSYSGVRYVEITKFRIDTGSVAMPWINGGSNIFWHKDGLKYGVMTFFGVANLLGIAERQPGVYRDFVYFGQNNEDLHTNVYTIFRMLIDDFGIVGALVFLFLLGFASAKAIEFIKKRKMIFLSQTFLVAVYSYVMWGFVASIWAYTSILCAYGLAFIIFSILQKPLHGDTWVTKITKKLKPKQK